MTDSPLVTQSGRRKRTVAVLSDLHSNRQALEAVLAVLPEVSEVVCLGDVVGYNGDPAWVLDTVREAGWLTIRGNHDNATIDPKVAEWFNYMGQAGAAYSRDQLGPERIEWLAALPQFTAIQGAHLVHGSLRDPDEYIIDGDSAWGSLSLVEPSAVAFHGHSHIPGIFTGKKPSALAIDQRVQIGHHYEADRALAVESPALVNPGSIGQPRDGNPGASFAVWNVHDGTVTFHRTPYDVEAAQAAVRAAGLPDRIAERLGEGR